MKDFAAALGLGMLALSTPALAQQQVWLQIEAQPSLTEATEAARSYAAQLDNVVGYDLAGRWYGIALGPFSPDEAERERANLVAAGLIPRDSFVADGGSFRQQFWPVGGAFVAPQVTAPPKPAAQDTAQPVAQATPTEESPAEARRSEALLDRSEREALQVALRFAGVYSSGIDGAFGPGTRRAMAEWQDANGFEPTGVLTSRQRNMVLGAYRTVIDSLALGPVIDTVAGITATLPLGLVAQTAEYTPPFARHDSIDGSGVRALFISQSGDSATLAGLYEIMQTLEIVPMTGERQLNERSFVLTGANGDIVSHTEARLYGNMVKGFTLIWPQGDEKRRALALDALQASFDSTGDTVLPDAYGADTVQDIDLLSGLEIRRPAKARTGFYVSSDGAVLTSAEAVAECNQITLGDTIEASVVATEDGLALLRPDEAIAPLSIGRFSTLVPRLQSEVTVAGYAFEGRLGEPTLNYGALEDIKGLDGDTALMRLALTSLPGEAGGPVFDTQGGIIGLLSGPIDYGRTLPEDVSFAYNIDAVASFLSSNGVTPSAADGAGAMPPEDLEKRARDVTVLVNCWD